MRKIRKRLHRLEQLSLFDEKPNRPKLIDLPRAVQSRVSDLIAQILVESLLAKKFPNDRKEVVNER